jgi:hypothetical protein
MILAACAVTASTVVIAVAVAPVVGGLLAIELDRSGGLFGTRIVRLASVILPKRVRQEHADEWADHVLSAGEAGFRPVIAAVELAVVTAPRMALRLRVRPAAGRYILALFLVAVEIVRADPDERRRGSTISMVKAILRLPALFTAPVMAAAVFRRMERTLPRWLFYATGTGIELALSNATAGLRLPIWVGLPLLVLIQGAIMSVGMLVVLKDEAVIRFASRWIGPVDE